MHGMPISEIYVREEAPIRALLEIATNNANVVEKEVRSVSPEVPLPTRSATTKQVEKKPDNKRPDTRRAPSARIMMTRQCVQRDCVCVLSLTNVCRAKKQVEEADLSDDSVMSVRNPARSSRAQSFNPEEVYV